MLTPHVKGLNTAEISARFAQDYGASFLRKKLRGRLSSNDHRKSVQKRQSKNRPPEQYWTGDFGGEVGRGWGFISSLWFGSEGDCSQVGDFPGYGEEFFGV